MSTAIAERPTLERLTDADWRPSATTTIMSWTAALSAQIRPHRALRYPFAGGEIIVTIPDSSPPWVVPTIERLGGLLALEQGWDSYGSPCIDPRYVGAAVRLILDAMQDDTPVPSVVPTSRGGVQLEWHTRGIDLEVEFVSPYRLRVFWQDQRTGQVSETEVIQDLRPLTMALATLSHPR